MVRNTVFLALLAGIGLVGAQSVPSEAQAGQKKAKKAPPYIHTVIFYIKKDAPDDAASQVIRDCHDLLEGIPSVRKLWAGRPAKKATPKVAVTDYQVGLMITFDNAKGLESYLVHPMHLEFVDRHKDSFEKVLVYDFMNQAK